MNTSILGPVIIKRTESVTDDEDKQNYNIRPNLLEDELKLSCCVLMLDITSKQVYAYFIYILSFNEFFQNNYSKSIT